MYRLAKSRGGLDRLWRAGSHLPRPNRLSSPSSLYKQKRKFNKKRRRRRKRRMIRTRQDCLSLFLPPGAVLENRRTKRARIKFLFFFYSFFLSGALSYSFPSMEAFCSNFVSFHSGRVGDKSRKAPEPQSVGERIMHKDVSTISFRFPIEYPMTSSRFFFFSFQKIFQDGHKEHPVEMAASPRRQGANAPPEITIGGGAASGGPSSHYQHTGGGGGGAMHPLSSVAAGTLGDRLAPHSSPGTGLRSMVVQSDFRKVFEILTCSFAICISN